MRPARMISWNRQRTSRNVSLAFWPFGLLASFSLACWACQHVGSSHSSPAMSCQGSSTRLFNVSTSLHTQAYFPCYWRYCKLARHLFPICFHCTVAPWRIGHVSTATTSKIRQYAFNGTWLFDAVCIYSIHIQERERHSGSGAAESKALFTLLYMSTEIVLGWEAHGSSNLPVFMVLNVTSDAW